MIDGYDWCRQRKLPSMTSHERKLYQPDDSDDGLRQDMRYGNDGHWCMVQKWRYGWRDHFWMFSCWSRVFFSSLDLGPVQMAFAQVSPPTNGGGVTPCGGSPDRLPSAVLIGRGTYCSYEYVRGMFVWLFPSFPFLVRVAAAQGVCSWTGGWCNGRQLGLPQVAPDVARAG